MNLALLLAVYAVALICTLCGSDLFLLNFHSDDLQRIEETLRGWQCYPIVQIVFATIENLLMGMYVRKGELPIWFPLGLFVTYVSVNILLTLTLGYYPAFVATIINVLFMAGVVLFSILKKDERWFIYLFRLAIALVVSFVLNEAIRMFRAFAFGNPRIDRNGFQDFRQRGVEHGFLRRDIVTHNTRLESFKTQACFNVLSSL